MSKKRRLPPMEVRPGGALIGPDVTGYTVGSWCPTQDGTGPAIAVAISMQIKIVLPMDIVLRLKSPARVDEMIQALLRHKRDVWPDSA